MAPKTMMKAKRFSMQDQIAAFLGLVGVVAAAMNFNSGAVVSGAIHVLASLALMWAAYFGFGRKANRVAGLASLTAGAFWFGFPSEAVMLTGASPSVEGSMTMMAIGVFTLLTTYYFKKD
jgi:hypothetical protein